MIDKMFDNHSGDHEIQLESWDMGFGAEANWGLGIFMVHHQHWNIIWQGSEFSLVGWNI